MPSTKSPVTVVQPGPGRLPAGTVSASSLTFEVASGAAPLASAVSTLAIGGETWSIPPADVQAVLEKSYQGLNARAYWVLDAAANADADFSGPTALNDAVTAFAASARKPALYLRAGSYTWTHPGNNALNNVRILGASGLVTITGNSFVVGLSTVLESVTVNTTAFVLFGGSATVRKVTLNTVSVGNLSDNNVFETVRVTGSGAFSSPGHNFSCSGDTVLTFTGAVSLAGNGASITGGAWQGSSISVTGSNNTFLGVPFTGTTSLSGSNNIYLSSGTTPPNIGANGIYLSNGAIAATDVNVKDDLIVGTDGSGFLEVRGAIDSTGNVTVGSDGSGNLTVNGTVTAAGLVTVNNELRVKDDVHIGIDGFGSLTVDDTITAYGPVTVNNSLTVTNDLTVNDILTANNNLLVANNATIGTDGTGNLTVNGNVTLGDAAADVITINGNTTFANSLTANGAVTLGDAAADVITINGNTTFANTLTANGAVTLGDAAADVITVNGNTTFANTLTANGTVTLGNAAADVITINGNTTFANTLAANGTVTLGNASGDIITVNGTTTVAAQLTTAQIVLSSSSNTVSYAAGQRPRHWHTIPMSAGFADPDSGFATYNEGFNFWQGGHTATRPHPVYFPLAGVLPRDATNLIVQMFSTAIGVQPYERNELILIKHTVSWPATVVPSNPVAISGATGGDFVLSGEVWLNTANTNGFFTQVTAGWTVNPDGESYMIKVDLGGTSNAGDHYCNLYALRIGFDDPGPRN